MSGGGHHRKGYHKSCVIPEEGEVVPQLADREDFKKGSSKVNNIFLILYIWVMDQLLYAILEMALIGS